MDHALLELLCNSIPDSPWEENLEELDHLTRSLDRRLQEGMGEEFAEKVRNAAEELSELRCRAAFRQGMQTAGRLFRIMLA